MDDGQLTIETGSIHPGEIETLTWNARFMTHDQFQRLVQNVKRDGCLTSSPLLYWPESRDRPLCLSGNHRTKAAIEAGLESIPVLIIRDELTADEQKAMQLAHNAVEGQDDASTLRALYESIEDIDLRQYSGLNDATLDLLVDVDLPSMADVQPKWHTLTMLLLPDEAEEMQQAFDEASKLAPPSDWLWLAALSQWSTLVDTIDTGQKAAKTTTRAIGLQVILDVFRAHVTDLADVVAAGLDQNAGVKWAPIAAVTGYDMPADALMVVRKALARIKGREDLRYEWQALEALAADFLAGVGDDDD